MRISKTFLLLFLLTSIQAAAQLRRVAVLDLAGRPGFDSVALVDSFLVMTHRATDTLQVFDPAKRRVVAQVKDLADPRGLVFHRPSRRLYVANSGNNSLAVISAEGWLLQDTIKLPHSPDTLLLVEPDRLYVGNWRDQSISVLDLGLGRVDTIDIDGRPEHMAYDPVRKVVFANVHDRNEVIALGMDNRIVARYPLLASQPTGMAIDPGQRRVYVAVRYAVVMLDADSGREIRRVPTAAGTDSLWLDPASHRLYAASAAGTVTVIRVAGDTFRLEQELNTEVRGSAIAYDPARNYVYLPGGREGTAKLLILRDNGAQAGGVPQSAQK